VQQWLDEKPERDTEFAKWEERHSFVRDAWEEWEKSHTIRHAIPSVDYLPDDPAARGKVCFRITIWDQDYDQSDYFYFVKTDPTWGDVFTFFDRSIGMTGDEHHCFLEGCYLVGERKDVSGEVIPVFEFSTGS
jgi:hypothetical protein